MTKRVEEVILENLINNEDFARQVLPFLQPEYFLERPDKLIFQEIKRHFDEYNHAPDHTSLSIAADKLDINKGEYDQVVDVIENLHGVSDQDVWLLNTTEKFCKDKALFNALMKSVNIIEGKDQSHSKEALPSILSEALAISFDKSVGHDFLADADSRYDFYHLKEDRVPFDLEMFNKVTKGGLPKKTLNVVLAGCVHPETKIKVRLRMKVA